MLDIFSTLINNFTDTIDLFKIIFLLFISYNTYTPTNNTFFNHNYIYFFINLFILFLSLCLQKYTFFKILTILSLVIHYNIFCFYFGALSLSYFLILYYLIYK